MTKEQVYESLVKDLTAFGYREVTKEAIQTSRVYRRFCLQTVEEILEEQQQVDPSRKEVSTLIQVLNEVKAELQQGER